MNKIAISALTVLLVSSITPAFAKSDCDAGYKAFLGKVTSMTETAPTASIAEAIRKSLGVYDACQAGDNLSPHGVWDRIAADLQAAQKK